ncbi:apolipoprotein N-acyltransferase [Candidatus Finniella inopinata]|uniref:Apolipoprotein N-acyltransferase n=1 Tax=Candidatus Finniella inopinata TaxID=1696036 RepID=A0A4Q7DHH2_9PROT|nr:apolipoprotein N-acyltransferase [Candidatus Finniella inopinata]RZI46162.1 apolipoprotein N-acyltransferase [Candidatus Finniella inopinata]
MIDLEPNLIQAQQFLRKWLSRYPYSLSFVLGAAASLAFAPLHLFFILIPCFLGLLTVLENKTIKQTFLMGWMFGWGHFSGGLYWIYFAFETANLTYFGPLAVVGLAGLMAIFPGLVCFLTALWSCPPLQKVWLFSALWALMEWLRSYLFTGFPWNLMGYTWTLTMLQSTAWIGVYGLSFLTVLAASALYSRSLKMTLSMVFVMAGLWVGGHYRLTHTPTLEHEDINLRLVQASIPQRMKWLPQERVKNLLLYQSLSQLAAERPLKAVIWPEAAVTIPLNQNPSLIDGLKTSISKDGVLITGGIRVIYEPNDTPVVYNCLYILDDQGIITDSYDKYHLTPFGEYAPFKSLIGIEKLTHGAFDYQGGAQLRVLSSAHLPPFQPLICYEGIFPQLVLGPRFKAQWLLSLTNDTWFGQSFGPYQHLAIVRVRAIEHGVPLIRAANNGVSAVVDPCGRVLQRLELNQIGYIDFALPKALVNPTFYSQWREIPFILMILVGLCVPFLGCNPHRRRSFKSLF